MDRKIWPQWAQYDAIDWQRVYHTRLSDEFIREFAGRVDWKKFIPMWTDYDTIDPAVYVNQDIHELNA